MLGKSVVRCEQRDPWLELPLGAEWAIGLTDPDKLDRAPAIVYSHLVCVSKGSSPSEALEVLEFNAGLEILAKAGLFS